MGIDKSSEKC